jgi:hypothetical protein
MKQTEEIISEVLSKVRGDRYTREKTCAQIVVEIGGVSDITIWRILRHAGFRKTKPTGKPGLTDEMKAARLKFALEHKDWTIDDWKKVIWTDERHLSFAASSVEDIEFGGVLRNM